VDKTKNSEMKFKTKEELLEEKYGLQIQTNNWEQIEKIEADSYKDGIDKAFDSFKERKEIYEKYRDGNNPIPIPQDMYYDFIADNYDGDKNWKDWLFKYCFGDIYV